MSFINKIKDNMRKNQVYYSERKHILKNFTMPQLRIVKKDYDIDISYVGFIDDKPRREDYIYCIAKSKKVSTEKLKDYLLKFTKKEEIEYFGKESAPSVQYNISMKNSSMTQSSIGGDVNIGNVLNDFSTAIVKSEINSNLIVESLKKIEELKSETSKVSRDVTKINKILEWFRNNKEELVAIAIPFISKISEWLQG